MSDLSSSGMPHCLFEKIVEGSIPSYKVYEDAKVLAFLDINPLSEGHTLVIPKKRFVTLDTVTDDYSAAIGAVLPRIARAVLKATGATNFNILQNNGRPAHQEIGHVHFHIIPKTEAGGLGTTGKFWRARPIDKATAPALASKIAELIAADSASAGSSANAADEETAAEASGASDAATAETSL